MSVDLVGSTAFKSKDGNTNLKWIKAFQKFYGEFPSQFAKNYKKTCAGIPEIHDSEADSEPKVWKTIGDEILFVNRVNSITQLGAFVRAFGGKHYGGHVEQLWPKRIRLPCNGRCSSPEVRTPQLPSKRQPVHARWGSRLEYGRFTLREQWLRSSIWWPHLMLL